MNSKAKHDRASSISQHNSANLSLSTLYKETPANWSRMKGGRLLPSPVTMLKNTEKKATMVKDMVGQVGYYLLTSSL